MLREQYDEIDGFGNGVEGFGGGIETDNGYNAKPDGNGGDGLNNYRDGEG